MILASTEALSVQPSRLLCPEYHWLLFNRHNYFRSRGSREYAPWALLEISKLFIHIPKKGNAKECSNYCTIVLISHASKIILKILQARLQQYMNCELPDVQADFRKGRGTRDQIASIWWIMEKAREFQKNIYFYFIDCVKVFVWITINCGKFWKRWEYQTTWPASWETCMQVRKQQLKPDMEQQTGSK